MTHIRLGTRGSQLALAQAKMLQYQIQSHFQNTTVEIVTISTPGDQDKTRPLSEIGGKGVFIKTLEQALLDDRVDIALHCQKDLTSNMHPNLMLSAFLPPESNLDVVISKEPGLDQLPNGAKVGTGSLRRKALLQYFYPHIKAVDIRGNIDTRIQYVQSGELDAVILAEAGLNRLGKQSVIAQKLPITQFVPAPGQGVLVVQQREKDHELSMMMAQLSDPNQTVVSKIELTFLEEVGFDCRMPLGLYVTLEKKQITVFLSTTKRPYWVEVFQLSDENWLSDVQSIAKEVRKIYEADA